MYLDSACMALKPRQVIRAMNDYYELQSACGGRSLHTLGKEVSDAVHVARESMCRFINASDSRECIWTKNATESLNIVAHCVELPKGSKIVTTSLEHHSGSLPFVERARHDGLKLEVVKSRDDGTFDIEDWKRAIDSDTRLVSVVHSSNVTGTVAPLREIVEIAHDRNALVVSDDAQYAPHHPMDVRSSDVDFSAISIHKMCGPTGMGLLYGKLEHLESMKMFVTGGDTVSDVRFEDGEILPTYLGPPAKFEAGLQNYAGIIGSGAAVDYLTSVGMHNVEHREYALLRATLRQLKDIKGIRIIGPDDPDLRSGVVTFTVDEIRSAHDVALFLSEEHNIMCRSGWHCTGPYHYQVGIPPVYGTVRASFYLYNNMDDVRTFLHALCDLLESSME